MEKKQIIHGLMGLNFLSIVVILFFDFAGTYYYQYKAYEISTYLYFGSGFLPTVALLAVMIFIGYVIYNLYKLSKVKDSKSNSKLVKNYYSNIKRLSKYSGIILLSGALVFIGYEIFSDDWWWFDTAFYLPFLTNIVTYFSISYFEK